VPLFDQLHPQWQSELALHKEHIEGIDEFIQSRPITPSIDLVFRALSKSIDSTRVVIFGQDPYPTVGHAHGLAFSVDSSVASLPASLRNIFKELHSDLGIDRSKGDLSDWSDQGIMLINRILTTEVGQSLAHENIGWQEVTNRVAMTLGQRDVIAVLWGNSAQELRKFFPSENVIASVHPSPLSAYRGFFDSKPFSQVNEKLIAKGYPLISW
jgi:uracil-DNA glycosylase